MKNMNVISDVSNQKRQLETTFDGNSQKRLHVDDDSDFFGLPHKVKHLFKKHKRVTQLYGLIFFKSLRVLDVRLLHNAIFYT